MAFTRGHRGHSLSLAASVDLDVEGGAGSRLEEDYDGGWSSSSNLSWSAKGPAAFLPSLSLKDSARLHLSWAKAGWGDANRWREATRVAMGAPDIRLGILKGLLLSGFLSALIFFFELAFFPTQLFGPPVAAKHHLSSTYSSSEKGPQTIASIGSVFFLYPLIAGCYFLASSWTMDVAQAAHRMRHGRGFSMSMNSIPPGTSRRLLQESYRILLVINFVAVSFLLEKLPLPFVGRVLSFLFMSFIDAYYCFEQVWIARGWSLERRMRYAESRWSYMVAFGLPSTAISFFHPSGLLNLMLFLLVFPMCTVLAMLATPQPRIAANSGTGLTPGSGTTTFTSGSTSTSSTTSMQLSSLLPPRLPIFWPTIKLYRLVLRVFPYSLEAAANAAASMQSRTGMGMGKITPDSRWRAAGGSGISGLGAGVPSAYAPSGLGNGAYPNGVAGGSAMFGGLGSTGRVGGVYNASYAGVGAGTYGTSTTAAYGMSGTDTGTATATMTPTSGSQPGVGVAVGAPGLAGRRSAAQFVGGAWNGAAGVNGIGGGAGVAGATAAGAGGGVGVAEGVGQNVSTSAYQHPNMGAGQWGVSSTSTSSSTTNNPLAASSNSNGLSNGSASLSGAPAHGPGQGQGQGQGVKNLPPPPKGPARGGKKND